MKRLIILALTLTAGLSACDVLDLEPKDRVTQFDYFKTANDLELFACRLQKLELPQHPKMGHVGNIVADGFGQLRSV